MNYKQIQTAIIDKDLAPVYFLMGEEPYYIDKLIKLFSENILNNEEKELNQIIVYGKETTTEQIISQAKQFPFGSERRVIIIKEAQDLKNIESLDSYIEKPQPNTILIIAYKGKSIDKRKKFGKTLAKKCIVFESKKLYENKVPVWISEYVNKRGYKISNEATLVLAEHLGSNLTKIENELEKLTLVIEKNQEITTELIERHIGISKEYNIFELQNALGKKDILQANKIINHFSANSKTYNIIVIINSLFSFFQKVMLYHFAKNKDRQSLSNLLKINPFFITQYQIAAQHYSKKQLFYIFTYLKEYDLRSKGLNNKSTSTQELLKELMFRITHI